MPEFLEYRYNAGARTIMAAEMLFIYMSLLGAITYSGALTIQTMAAAEGYGVSLAAGALAIGVIAMLYVAAGGLKACAWADLIQGSALIVGGAVVMVFAFRHLGLAPELFFVENVQTGAVGVKSFAEDVGALARFHELNSARLNMFLPAGDPVVPWTALLLGLWIPNFYYWGLNQYITQRTLGSRSLSQGQRGIVFAAFLKLLIPFVIVFPGLMAFNLFSGDMKLQAREDNAPVMARYLKANPATALVDVRVAPPAEVIAAWQPGRYLLAVFESAEAVKAVEAPNAFVLPIRQADFDAAAVKEFTVFKSDDKAWPSVHPALAAEVGQFNKGVEDAATTAGKLPDVGKFTAYKYDAALGHLLARVLPKGIGLRGFVLAALLGAVVSSLAAMLNAASTIFSMDIYKKFIAPGASHAALVFLGRLCVVAFTVIAVVLAPQLGNPHLRNSIFQIIQESQGFISPGILAVFVFGLIMRRAPAASGVAALLLNIAVYGVLMQWFPGIQFLNRMALCFALCLALMLAITLRWPLAQPVTFPRKTDIDLESSRGAKVAGVLVVILTLVLYVVFSPLVLAR